MGTHRTELGHRSRRNNVLRHRGHRRFLVRTRGNGSTTTQTITEFDKLEVVGCCIDPVAKIGLPVNVREVRSMRFEAKQLQSY